MTSADSPTLLPRVALAMLLVSSSGCAFTNIPITLPDASLETRLSGGRERQVVVAPFRDDRQVFQRCGRQINGYGMDTADALCQGDPAAWMTERLTAELRRAGFSVLELNAAHRPGALRMDGSLLQLFIEPKIGFWTGSLEADLSVKLEVRSETGLLGERTFFVKGWKGGVLAATTQPFLTSLHRATQAIVEEMVRAVIELMDAYPQLGSQRPNALIALAIRPWEGSR